MKALLAILLLFACCSPASADLRTDAPSTVITYLDSAGLATRNPWRLVPDHGWLALSDYKALLGAGGLAFPEGVQANNLAVYYTGDEKRVTEARLVFSMFHPALRHNLNDFADAAAKLCEKATGVPLSQSMRNALLGQKTHVEAANKTFRLSSDRAAHGHADLHGPCTLRFIITLGENPPPTAPENAAPKR